MQTFFLSRCTIFFTQRMMRFYAAFGALSGAVTTYLQNDSSGIWLILMGCAMLLVDSMHCDNGAEPDHPEPRNCGAIAPDFHAGHPFPNILRKNN